MRTTFDWIDRHARFVIAAVVLAALTLGFIGPLFADTDEPSFDPSGEVFDITNQAEVSLASTSTIGRDTFLVEAPDGGADVLTAAALGEWQAISDEIRTDDANTPHLAGRYDQQIDGEVPAVFSIADVVDGLIPGGLATATDRDVKDALAALESEGSPVLLTLSEQARTVDGKIEAPAFLTEITYDRATFSDGEARELWLRDIQASMQEHASFTDPIGVGIDFDTTFNEAIEASAPFIFLAVALVVLVVAAVHRSYWSSVLVASGLGATMLVYNGIAALVGLQMGSLLLAFIVPIAMISFGVDFYIHGIGRVREMQVDHGMSGRSAYTAGMRAVFSALLLAAVSSVAAFLANVTSGTEAIVEFGLGAAIALGTAYLILGLLTPRVVVGVEAIVVANPAKRFGRVAYALALVPVAVIGGLAVALAAVQPAIGVAAVVAQMLLVVAVPVWLTRRRNRRAAARGKTMVYGVRGAAHGLDAAGTVVRGVAARKAITIPVLVLVAATLVFGALRVESGFTLTDFLASDTDVVQSIDRFGEHFPSTGEGGSFVYVEGDLTQPDTLLALEHAVRSIDSAGTGFGRDAQGGLDIGFHAADVVRAVMANETIAGQLGLTDGDADGLPDTAAQVAAVYSHVWENGLVDEAGAAVIDAESITSVVAPVDGEQATALRISVTSFTDAAVIEPVITTLEAVVSELEAMAPDLTTVGYGGEVVAQHVSLESFRSSMLLALPIAVLLTLIVAMVLLRSVRFAVAAVVPIGFVVAGVYAVMALVGFRINVVTATIAAIAVGVGIDFSTHFTARYLEELRSAASPLDALRRAGAGTGGALVLSALTSILGFTVMAFAPTPIFSVYGVLTAVMIGLALSASLLVLPTVLLLVTPRRWVSPPAAPMEEKILARA